MVATRNETRPAQLSDEAITSLAGSLRGQVIHPGADGYDDARRVYNAMIDRRPAMIVRCADVADVMTAVNFARENGVLVAVRGGGHNGGGLGVCDDGMVIDLADLDGIHVDPKAKTVRVGGGATLGQLDHATHAFGMAVPSGIISTTGVGGITLGGGLGHVTRSGGLAIDNLLAADLVLADGRYVTASADENADLFWAIRGGGGNFGIVTSFLFTLLPFDVVYAGPMLWPLERAADVLTWYRDFIPNQPDEMNGFFAFLTVPPGPPFPEELHGQKVCGVVWCYTGPLDTAESAFAPIRGFIPPILDWVGPIPHSTLNNMFDPIYPPGDQWYWKADYVNEISDEAVALHVEHGSQLPTWKCTMHLYPIDGAAGRVGKTDTPWAYRDAKWAEVIVGVSSDPAEKEIITTWARDYWSALHPYCAPGAYINFMMDEGQERVQATYRENYARLAEIKREYDPENFFRVNQNIQPAG